MIINIEPYNHTVFLKSIDFLGPKVFEWDKSATLSQQIGQERICLLTG